MDSNNLENLLEDYQKTASRKAWAQKVMGNPELYIEESNNFYIHNIGVVEEIEALVENGILGILNHDIFGRYKELSLDDKLNCILKESGSKLPYLYERISSIINPHKLILLDLESTEHITLVKTRYEKEDLESERGMKERGYLYFKLDLPFDEFLEKIDLSCFLYNANRYATEKNNKGDIEEKIKSKKEDFFIYYHPEGKLEYYWDRSRNFIWTVFKGADSREKRLSIFPSEVWVEYPKGIFTIIDGDWTNGMASLISSYIKLDSA